MKLLDQVASHRVGDGGARDLQMVGLLGVFGVRGVP